MSDTIIDQPTPASAADRQERWFVGGVYVLYLMSLPSLGLTTVIGVIIALARKDEAPAWLRSHYDFQIWTFIYPLLLGLILFAMALTIILIPLTVIGGLLCGLFLALWILARCGVGLVRLVDGRPNPDPRSVFV